MKCPRLRYLLPLLASLILVMGADSIATYAPNQYNVDQRIASITYEAACRIAQYEICPDKGPAVRRSAVVGEIEAARGIYFVGSYVVWLDPTLGGTQSWLTTFHEQIHFLQSANLAEMAEYEDHTLDCIVEREALDFTNAYALELRRPDLQRTLATWYKLYKCSPRMMHR